ncbi:hypothetical protein K435DRAFT_800562 [Dendrothele bispora CBS 962.96]|uniref:Uncharacterized protein n=1 Tax=Dendrothele bispora (strain CBS 962.96) TaxID=1314807 RepID=A0A4S8LTN7_DENBC|nr:hypothetical protein K435DRAFT_800562 [Dendrothele bispora CBS 962.96]
MASEFPLTPRQSPQSLQFKPKLENYRPKIERYSTLLFEYMEIIETVGISLRADMTRSVNTYNELARRRATQSPPPAPRLSDKNYVQYLLMLQSEAYKKTETVEERIKVASAAHNLIVATQNYIGSFPESVQLDIIRQVSYLHQAFLSRQSGDMWAPPTWSSEDRPMLCPPQSELSLSRAQIGSLARDQLSAAQESSDRLARHSLMSTVPPSGMSPLPLSERQKEDFRANLCGLFGKKFRQDIPNEEPTLFEVIGLSRDEEEHYCFKLKMSAVVDEIEVKEGEFWELVDNSRWVFNDALRHEERRRVFNVNGLSRLAAESTNRSPDDIVGFEKLAEGGFNRAFLITMRDSFQLVARIPYPVTVPKFYTMASEVATMDYLRSFGLPIPNVYGYSPTSDNVAETEYIFMEFVNGTNLSEVWFDLEEQEIVSVVGQLVELEAKMMSVCFPAGGILYYAQDLERMTGKTGIPLKDKRFCVGPDVRLSLWHGRRSHLNVDRGPYKSVESALVGAANKELAYLHEFGQPLLPFQRIRRESYQYREQSPSDHIDSLKRYLQIAPSLVPKEPSLNQFRIRHPDLQETNIVVSRLSNPGLQVISVLDWQHTSILPTFLLAGMPQRMQNYTDSVSQSMTQPSLPKNFDDLEKGKREWERERYRRRLIHYHYLMSTAVNNDVHQAALADPLGVLRRRLFQHAGHPWEGEAIALKVALIEATIEWEKLTERGLPCPVVFDTEDVCETMKLDTALKDVDKYMEAGCNIVGCTSEVWVPNDHYERAMARSKELKEQTLVQTELAKERAEVESHWPFDDMDEGNYM